MCLSFFSDELKVCEEETFPFMFIMYGKTHKLCLLGTLLGVNEMMCVQERSISFLSSSSISKTTERYLYI